MSWKPEVEVNGKWTANECAFATEAEARSAADDIFSRWWVLCTNSRAVPSTDRVNWRWINGEGLKPLDPEVKP